MNISSFVSRAGALALWCVWLPGCAGGAEDESGSGGSSDTGGSASSGGSSDTGGSSSSGGSSSTACDEPVLVSWTEGGNDYEASYVLEQNTSGYFAFNAPACDGVHQVVFKYLPVPIVTGTYDLRFHLLGETGEVEPGAQYISADGQYATTTGYTGELTIASVNTDAGTFSGTFHYEAIDAVSGDENNDTVSITDGVLTNVPYE